MSDVTLQSSKDDSAASLALQQLQEHLSNTTAHRRLKSGPFWQHIPAYSRITEDEFNNHKWQLKHSITSVRTLLRTLRDMVDEEFYQDMKHGFKLAPMAVRVSPYVISLINWDDPYNDPLRKQFIPLASSGVTDHPELELDALHEQADSPVPGLTHRYPDKALFLALDICPVYCRYCTRSYAVGRDTQKVSKLRMGQNEQRWQQVFDYIRAHTQLEDIVVSGGDPYMLSTKQLKLIGESLLAIPHVRRIRLGTKGPAILPQKILTDNAWYQTLRSLVRKGRSLHKEVCVHTHFSHPNEITEITQRAMNRFMEDAIPVRNQAVLQREVNDSPQTMVQLNRRLGFLNARPYYVYMHDMVKGVEDLRTTLQRGIDLEKFVRGMTAGFNTPTFVVDTCGGGGKREIHSYEYYDPETGIAVYTAPLVKPGEFFFYFDPLDTLTPDIRRAWLDPAKRKEMKEAALEEAAQNINW